MLTADFPDRGEADGDATYAQLQCGRSERQAPQVSHTNAVSLLHCSRNNESIKVDNGSYLRGGQRMNDRIRVIAGQIQDLGGDRSLQRSAAWVQAVVRVSFNIGDPSEHIEFTEGGNGALVSGDCPLCDGEYLAVAVARIRWFGRFNRALAYRRLGQRAQAQRIGFSLVKCAVALGLFVALAAGKGSMSLGEKQSTIVWSLVAVGFAAGLIRRQLLENAAIRELDKIPSL
jgi:hypothetical protein